MPPAKFNPAQRGDKSRKAALARLEVKWRLDAEDDEVWEPDSEPIIATPLMKSVEGGIDHCITCLRASSDEDAQAFIEMWDSLSATDRKNLRLEDVAHAAGIGAVRLSEVTNTAVFFYGNMQTQMMLAAGLPKIVATSIKQAKTAKGLADREWMLKAGKILPIPKGAQTAIQINTPEAEIKQIESGHTWQYPEDRLKAITGVLNPRQLEAGNKSAEIVHLSHNSPNVFER